MRMRNSYFLKFDLLEDHCLISRPGFYVVVCAFTATSEFMSTSEPYVVVWTRYYRLSYVDVWALRRRLCFHVDVWALCRRVSLCRRLGSHVGVWDFYVDVWESYVDVWDSYVDVWTTSNFDTNGLPYVPGSFPRPRTSLGTRLFSITLFYYLFYFILFIIEIK